MQQQWQQLLTPLVPMRIGGATAQEAASANPSSSHKQWLAGKLATLNGRSISEASHTIPKSDADGF